MISAACDIRVAIEYTDVVGYLAMKGSYFDRLYVDPKAQRMNCGGSF